MSNLKESRYTDRINVKEINLKDIFEVMKKRFWIIIVITVLATLAGYYYSNSNNVPLYKTTTRIIIGPDSDMKTLMVMVKDPIIMEKVKKDLEFPGTPESIASLVEVARIDESQVISISATANDPLLAMNIANGAAKAFKSEVGNLLNFNDVQLLSEAKENPYPINENQNRLVIIALVFGLLTGIGLVFLLDSLDGTVNKESEVEGILGVPVIGVVSNMNRKKYFVKKRKQKEVKLRGETVDIK